MSQSHGNQVIYQQMWEERLKKETKGLKLRLDFTANPRTLNWITEKPHKVKRRDIIADGKKKDVNWKGHLGSSAEIVDTINKSDLSPKNKYKFPLTSNQNYGWDQYAEQMYSPRSKKLFSQHLEPSKVTSYVDHYIKNQGQSPFKNRTGRSK